METHRDRLLILPAPRAILILVQPDHPSERPFVRLVNVVSNTMTLPTPTAALPIIRRSLPMKKSILLLLTIVLIKKYRFPVVKRRSSLGWTPSCRVNNAMKDSYSTDIIDWQKLLPLVRPRPLSALIGS